jgi:hypothetical protein
MTRRIVALTSLMLVAAWAPAVPAQDREGLKALEREIEALKQGQERLHRDLEEIKGLLRARPPAATAPEEPKNLVLSIDGRPAKGDADARLVLIDFTDYQ